MRNFLIWLGRFSVDFYDRASELLKMVFFKNSITYNIFLKKVKRWFNCKTLIVILIFIILFLCYQNYLLHKRDEEYRKADINIESMDSVAIFAKACFGHPSLKQAAKT
jgi:hypothetical protein